MTKKDYQLLADTISKAYSNSEDSIIHNYAVDHVARKIAQALQEDSPKFDTNRFLTACGASL